MDNMSISFKNKEYAIANKLNVKLSYLEKIRIDFKKAVMNLIKIKEPMSSKNDC